LKKLALISALIIFTAFAEGQQLPLYSQYLYNKFLINPAVAGSDGFTSLDIQEHQELSLSAARHGFLREDTNFRAAPAEIVTVQKQTARSDSGDIFSVIRMV
jgi:hypothetical protein